MGVPAHTHTHTHTHDETREGWKEIKTYFFAVVFSTYSDFRNGDPFCGVFLQQSGQEVLQFI